MIEIAAEALSPFLKEIAFVGGASAVLYIDDLGVAPLRPTEDVDCVIEISSRSEYARLEERLRKLGFVHDSTVICRWKVKDILIDVMPTEEAILGFSNRWYLSGLKAREKRVLPSGTAISIFPLAYYLASKFEALNNRGGADLRQAYDLEDILLVLDGCKDPLPKLKSAAVEVRRYLAEVSNNLLARVDFDEILICHLGTAGDARVRRAKQLIKSLAEG